MPDFEHSDLAAAKYAVVHDYPGGARALAPLVGKSPAVLSNKVNPTLDTHHLSVDESVTIQAVARDYRILQAEARVLGHVCIPMPADLPCSDVKILNAYADWTADIGETAQAIKAALADPHVSRERLREIKREIHEDNQRALVLFSRLEQISED